MENPIDVLGVHPTGAHPRRQDLRDFPFAPREVAQAGKPFQWEVGNGPDPELVKLLTIKEQGSSGSCGGQAFSYYGQRLRNEYANDPQQRSAKYMYSQVYVPGGGSSDRDLAAIAKNQGFGLEVDTSSYQGTRPPTESFMERPQDITSHARLGAGRDKISIAYAFPEISLESIAQAASACQGVIIGIHGENNGTWLSPVPKSPQNARWGISWAHYMYGAQPQIYQGKKGIWCPQSWGLDTGINGWQFIDEDYFASGAVWASVVLIYNPSPVGLAPHVFDKDIKFGAEGEEVLALQQYLAYDGVFKVAPTGYYGNITAQAVLAFQLKYQLASAGVLAELGGHIVGPATRAKLNNLV